jgi:aminopeptidase
MTISSFEDFLYAACLIDWDAAAATMGPIAALFTQADEVRVVGHGTDLVLGVAGRAADVEDGRINMPGGEIYCCPVEDSVEGVIAFSEFPPVVAGVDVRGARLVFESGKVVDASAEAGEELLLDTLATDEGARRVGELGIGCNPGITRYMKNAMFDEKIEGTAHIGLGAGFPSIGGTNTSAIHMDLVKDLRNGGRIYCDGRIVQENGVWVH